MNLIDKQLKKIKSEKRLGLMTHLVAGYPSLSATKELAKAMEDFGADFIELQIPFSDPLADGPTIMRACEQALQKGLTVKDVFKLAKILTKEIKIPLIFMAYYNTVFKYGTEKFCENVYKVGVSGMIVPDMPIEEEPQEHFMRYCKNKGLKNIRVISPVSTVDRLKKNAQVADGFIYCTARQGITGAKKDLDSAIGSFLKEVKKYFKIPIAVGFGISNKERIRLVAPFTDIVVIGSVIIDIINKSGQKEIEKNVHNFLFDLKEVLTTNTLII